MLVWQGGIIPAQWKLDKIAPAPCMRIYLLAQRALIMMEHKKMTIRNLVGGAMRWYHVGLLENDHCQLAGLRDVLGTNLVHSLTKMALNLHLITGFGRTLYH